MPPTDGRGGLKKIVTKTSAQAPLGLAASSENVRAVNFDDSKFAKFGENANGDDGDLRD